MVSTFAKIEIILGDTNLEGSENIPVIFPSADLNVSLRALNKCS
jgi:hypothetical protein